MGIDAVTVVNDELVALTTDHTLPELLPCPFRCRMPSHVHVEDASRLDFHDQQHVDDAECSGDDDEEVRCDDCLGMITFSDFVLVPAQCHGASECSR